VSCACPCTTKEDIQGSNLEVLKVQDFKKQLMQEANKLNNSINTRRVEILNKIQEHAITQVKEGYTSFRITNLDKDELDYLKEWSDISSAEVKEIKFKCYTNNQKYLVRQYEIDLQNVINAKRRKEGNSLVF
jgi:hypothetical protein